MVLLLSSAHNELTTEEMIEWLNYLGVKSYRLNGDDLIDHQFNIELGNMDGVKTSFEDIFASVCVIWNRRWTNYSFLDDLQNSDFDGRNVEKITRHLRMEFYALTSFLINLISEKTVIVDRFNTMVVNKLQVLKKAKELGLKIPETIITNSKNELKLFIQKHKRIITKTISEVANFTNKKNLFVCETLEVDENYINKKCVDRFFPSLFQKMIMKKIDIRIFYLDGIFFPMAIFSQRRKEASVDFREYDFQDPDRNVPYKLPECVEIKLHKLVSHLELTNCSIDMVEDIYGEYYFIEVNPVGQFGMVSKPCNYYLEYKLAVYLSNLAKNN